MAAGLGLPPPSYGPPSTFDSSTELLTSLKQEFTHATTSISIPTSNSTTSASSWVCVTPDGTVWVPGVTDDEGQGGLKEDRSGYDVTAKLFYLVSQPSADASARAEHTEDALGMVSDVLGTDKVDLCIVSFPGVYFDANDEASSATSGDGGDNTVAQQEETKTFVETYAILEKLARDGRIGRIGLSEFGTARLAKLFAALEQQQQDKEGNIAPTGRIRPRVVQINVRDCCVVPKELILYAKRQGIELLTHNDCADILTKKEIEKVVEEGGVWDALWEHESSLSMPEDNVAPHKPKPRLELFPQWVVKYTAVVRDRGVVENKGYVFHFPPPLTFTNANKRN